MRIGFLGLLGLILITLKLTEYIAISWWLVLLPIYIIPLIVIVMPFIVIGVAAIAAWISTKAR